MEISKRLLSVADEVLYETIADIGTDHGYLPIYLIKSGKVKNAVACDINAGPLKKALENIKANNLEDKVDTRLGDGLSGIFQNEVKTVVIAGMGGLMICKILDEGKNKLKYVKQLVLQPQRDSYCVRKKIHELGFKIINEEMIFESGKYYNIINSVKGREKYTCENDYLFGKILLEKNTKVFRNYIKNRVEKYEGVLSLMSSDSNDYGKVSALVEKYKEVLNESRTDYKNT